MSAGQAIRIAKPQGNQPPAIVRQAAKPEQFVRIEQFNARLVAEQSPKSVQVERGGPAVLAVIERGDGTAAWRFPTIDPPSTSDYADASRGHASIRVVKGKMETNVGNLLDGRGQSTADSPGESAVFADKERGGRILLDLGQTVSVRKINTYSWHDFHPRNIDYHLRAPQHYDLFGYAGPAPPATDKDLRAAGWVLIARVNTDEFFKVPPVQNRPAQQAVSLTAARGPLGAYRYLLWDIKSTTRAGKRGDINTFYGEFDVYAEPGETQRTRGE